MQTLTPLRKNIFLVNLDHGERKSIGGVIIMDDNGKQEGIRPRWAEVFSVGPEQLDVKPGDRVLMQHGRWSLSQDVELNGETVRVWLGDPDGILGVETKSG